MTQTPSLLQQALAAYGGQVVWSQAHYIEAEVSTQGLAFILKRRPYFNHARLVMDVTRPVCRITPVGKQAGVSGVLEGTDVRLEDAQGNILTHRENARSHFTWGRRLLYWDDLDMAYFANYAFWNYFTLPALLMNLTIVWEEQPGNVLKATFPDSIPTHSTVQYFHFDAASGLLSQHDYTARIISRFANAANVVLAHGNSNGIPFTAKRRVTPAVGGGKYLPAPVLIDIDVHAFRLLDTERNPIRR